MTDRGNSDVYGSKWHPVVIAIVSAIIGSSGGVAVLYNTDYGQTLTRPDPYLGAQGASLEARVDHIEGDMNDHLARHPDDVNQFDRRIATLEAQYVIILQNQIRMIDRLEKIGNN
jgi:hypothetical protein